MRNQKAVLKSLTPICLLILVALSPASGRKTKLLKTENAACNWPCDICEPSQTSCEYCYYGWYLTPSGTCESTCPQGTYFQWQTGPWYLTSTGGYSSSYMSCQSCYNYACSSCTGAYYYQCTSCNTGYFLTASGTCSSTCPSGTYANTATSTCISCDTSCGTCNGGSKTQCLTCSSGYFFQPSSTTTCGSTCPSGYYPNSTTSACSSKTSTLFL